MRRSFGGFLILVFWLGPLLALLPASTESRLPACCRRHGAHHCAMAPMQEGVANGAAPAFGASSHCPRYPATLAASVAPLDALTVSAPRTPAQAVQSIALAASVSALQPAVLYSRLNRGPPAAKRA
jgi:hypothetical protein